MARIMIDQWQNRSNGAAGKYERIEVDLAGLNPTYRKRVEERVSSIKRALQENEREQLKEREQMMKRLPEQLLKKHAAGYTKKGEIEREICNLAIADMGFDYDPWQDSVDCIHTEPLNGLSDDEFDLLTTLQDAVQEGTSVQPLLAWIVKRESDEDETEGGGEQTSSRRIFLIKWLVAGLSVRAIVPLEKSAVVAMQQPQPGSSKKAKR